MTSLSSLAAYTHNTSLLKPGGGQMCEEMTSNRNGTHACTPEWLLVTTPAPSLLDTSARTSGGTRPGTDEPMLHSLAASKEVHEGHHNRGFGAALVLVVLRLKVPLNSTGGNSKSGQLSLRSILYSGI
eukprot:2291681-Amphidinium_carterae.1